MKKNKKVNVYNKGNHDLPIYTTDKSAGFDLVSDFSGKNDISDFIGNNRFLYNKNTKEIILKCNGGRVLIPTGLFISLPDNYELQIRPRSGLALKHGISIVNSPGTIDSDYRGEIGIILINTDPDNDFIIKDGERIAQGVLNKVKQISWNEVKSIDDLGETERGVGGFGHTGK